VLKAARKRARKIRNARIGGWKDGLEVAAHILETKLSHYPVSIFPEPPPGMHGKTVDACSASALRIGLRQWADEVRHMAHQSELCTRTDGAKL